MSRAGRTLRLSWQALTGRRSAWRIPVLCLMILTMLPMVLQGISGGMGREIAESRKDVYGDFSDVFYLEFTADQGGIYDAEQAAKNALEGVTKYSSGTLYSVYRERTEHGWINMGYGDKNAVKYGRIQLLQGHFPETETEAAITEGFLEEHGFPASAGQSVTVNGQEFEVSGILRDYGRLWPRRDKEIQEGIGAVNIFISEKAAKAAEAEAVLLQMLIQRETEEIPTVREGEFIQNINGQKGRGQEFFSVPKGLMLLLYLCEGIIFFNVLLLSREKIWRRFGIYRQHGMGKKQALSCIFTELLLSVLAGILTGIFAGTGILMVILKSFHELLSADISAGVCLYAAKSGSVVFLPVLLCVFSFTIMIVSTLSPVPGGRKRRKSAVKPKKFTFWRLMVSEFRTSRMVGGLLILLLAFNGAFLGSAIVYKNYFAAEATYKQYEGKMPFDYDMELATVVREPEIFMDEAVYQDDTYEKDGASEEFLSRLKMEKGLERISAYKENNKIKLLLDKEQFDRYLDASDYVEDGVYNPAGDVDKIRDIFEYGDKRLVKTKVVGYNDNELLALQPYVTEGNINLEKLRSGEEIILVAPPFTLTTQTDGGIRKDWCRPGSAGAYENHLLHAGDTITLTRAESEKGYNGGVNRETLQREYQRKDKAVTVGAVLGTYTGWFENEATMGESYYIYTLHDAFRDLGMNDTYNRLRLYIDLEADYTEMSELVKSYGGEVPHMRIQDLHRELETYRQLKWLIAAFCAALTFLAGGMILCCTGGQLLFKTQLNLKKYMLLRINGMSVRKLGFMIVAQAAVLGIAGMLLSVPLTVWAVKTMLHLSTERIWQYLAVPELVGAAVCMAPLLLAASVPSVILVKKTRIKDLL